MEIITAHQAEYKISPLITTISQDSTQRFRNKFYCHASRSLLHSFASKGVGFFIQLRVLQVKDELLIIACNIMATNRNQSARQQPTDAEKNHSRVWTLANLLTLLRIALMFPFLALIKEGRFGAALLVFFVASVTDFADGFVARRFNQKSTFGRFLDPLADKLLTTASFIVMALRHEGFPSIPPWLAIAVVGRDALILAGSLIVYFKTKFRDFKPTLLGKLNTFFELGLIVVFLTFHHFETLRFLLPLCYAIVIASVAASGIEYVAQGIRIMRDHRNRPAQAGVDG
jgi:cardiolipin synthase (CMP-forming)